MNYFKSNTLFQDLTELFHDLTELFHDLMNYFSNTLFQDLTELFHDLTELFHDLMNYLKTYPVDEIHLFCLHFVYVPRINRHLESWKQETSMDQASNEVGK